MAKKTHPNVSASYYDGETQIACDCVGEDKCKFALGFTMPIEPDETCTYSVSGNCHNPHAQLEAMKKLAKNLNAEIKSREEAEAS
jgi:hypothetical protein